MSDLWSQHTRRSWQWLFEHKERRSCDQSILENTTWLKIVQAAKTAVSQTERELQGMETSIDQILDTSIRTFGLGPRNYPPWNVLILIASIRSWLGFCPLSWGLTFWFSRCAIWIRRNFLPFRDVWIMSPAGTSVFLWQPSAQRFRR